MFKKLTIKFTQLILTLFLATFAVFLLIHNAPSDPISMMMSRPDEITLASDKQALERKIQERKEELGLNESIPVQYKNWILNISKGNLGKSLITKQDVKERLITYFPNSLIIAVTGTLLQFSLALIFGILSVVYTAKWIEHLIRILAIFFRSVPFFAISIFLLILCATKFRIYEVKNSAELSRLWLPTIAVGITMFPKLSRIIRNSLLDELGKKYMVSYFAKGFPRKKILKEALRNAMIPIFTALNISFATSIGGMVIAESIFTWPGLGNYGMNAVLTQDYTVIQGYILTTTFFVVIVNFINELFYPIMNPMIKTGDRL